MQATTEPILEFTDLKQAYECLKYWQKLLFLDDHIIKLELHDKIIGSTGNELAGQVDRITDNKTAIIQILKKDYFNDQYVKFCAEETLVHELMHIRLDLCSHDKDASVEGIVYDTITHQMVSMMARSLIMAKYGVTFDYFKAFKEE